MALQEQDGGDKLLLSEKSHLISLKRSLEAQLQRVQMQLQELSVSRNRLAAAIQERSRVTDLLCNSISSDNYYSNHTRSQTPRDSVSNLSMQRPFTRETPCYKEKEENRTGATSRAGSHLKAYSAPVPLELGTDHNMHVEFRSGSIMDIERTCTPGIFDRVCPPGPLAIPLFNSCIAVCCL